MKRSRHTIHGIHNILTGMDLHLRLETYQGENMPSRLVLEWRKAAGGFLAERDFKGILMDVFMEQEGEANFAAYYKRFMLETAQGGNVPRLGGSGPQISRTEEEHKAYHQDHNLYHNEEEPWDRTIDIREAEGILRRLAGRFDLKLGNVDFINPFVLGNAIAAYFPAGIMKCRPRSILFHPGVDIKLSTTLHEFVHAIIHQNLDDHLALHSYFAEYHGPLFHILYSELCRDTVGADAVAMRADMRAKGVLGGVTEEHVAIILKDVWDNLESRPRIKPQGFAEPGRVVSAKTGFEMVWSVGCIGRHKNEKPKPLPQNLRNIRVPNPKSYAERQKKRQAKLKEQRAAAALRPL